MKNKKAWDEGTKKRLLEAAGEIFAQKGYHAATVRDICKKADASVSAINYHFRDKEALYVAVFEYAYQNAMEKFPLDLDLTAEPSPAQRLQAFIRSNLLSHMDSGFPAWYEQFISHEMSNPTNMFESLKEKYIQPMHSVLEEIVCEILRETNPNHEPDAYVVQTGAVNIVGACFLQHHARRVIQLAHPINPNKAQIEDIAEQVYLYSLAGLRALATAAASKS